MGINTPTKKTKGMKNARTESHELRPDGHREHNQVEHLDRLEVGVEAIDNENGADIEEERLGEVD